MKKLMLFVPADLLLKLFWNTLFHTWNHTQSSSSGLLGLVFLWGFSLAERLIKADLQKTSIWSFKSKRSAFHQTISEKGSSFWQTVTNTSSSFFTWIFFSYIQWCLFISCAYFYTRNTRILENLYKEVLYGGGWKFCIQKDRPRSIYIYSWKKIHRPLPIFQEF